MAGTIILLMTIYVFRKKTFYVTGVAASGLKVAAMVMDIIVK
jgi:hypothetical protein